MANRKNAIVSYIVIVTMESSSAHGVSARMKK